MPFYPIKYQHLHPIFDPPDRDPDWIKQEQERNLKRIWGDRFYKEVEAMIKERRFKWIPWQRYIVKTTVNNKQTIFSERLRYKKKAHQAADRLSQFAGLKTEVIDTKDEMPKM